MISSKYIIKMGHVVSNSGDYNVIYGTNVYILEACSCTEFFCIDLFRNKNNFAINIAEDNTKSIGKCLFPLWSSIL